jgi:O-antigen ligase
LFFVLEAVAGRVHLWPGLIATATGGGLLLFQAPVLMSRLSHGGGGNDDRALMFRIYWRAFQESPLMGYGLGTFDTVNKLNLSASTFEGDWSTRAAHNVYLQWLMEAGLIGALPMFACIGLVMFKTWRGMQRRRRATSLIRGLLAADAVFLVHGWTDFALQVPSMAALFAFILGLQLGLANSSSSAPQT